MKYRTGNNVTLIGGGPCARETFELAMKIAPALVAADSGAAHAIGWGRVPELVVGDMDSLAPELLATLAPDGLRHIDEQETTDFDKALGVIRAPLILGLGFLGGRLDHTLANLASLVRFAARPCVLLGEEDLCFHAPPRLDLTLPRDCRLSLFPLQAVAVRGAGLVWPVEGLNMRPTGQIGTSNAVGPGGRVTLGFDRPGMLVMLPLAQLNAALSALAGAPSWPENPENG